MGALLSWGPAALWAGFIFFLSHQPGFPAPAPFPYSDKVAHLILFGIFGGTLAWGTRKWSKTTRHGALILLGLLYAASDEWHQSFIPGRYPSTGDFLADAVGLVSGYLLIRSILKAYSRKSA